MKKPLILSVLVVALCLLPFFIPHGGEYSGSDDQAENAIQQLAPHYQPWAKPLFEPASSEIESLLCPLPGCIGTAISFYILGYSRGKRSSTRSPDRAASKRAGDQAEQADHAHH